MTNSNKPSRFVETDSIGVGNFVNKKVPALTPEQFAQAIADGRNAGLNYLPCVPDTKRPDVGKWKPYQTAEYNGDIKPGNCGIVGGYNNVYCIDFDVFACDFDAWTNGVNERGLSDALARCYIENTPHGMHVIYRLDGMTNADRDAELTIKTSLNVEFVKSYLKAKGERREYKQGAPVKTIETRGAGGFVVCYPSPQYTPIQNTPATMGTLTRAEHEAFLTSALELSDAPKRSPEYEAQTIANVNDISEQAQAQGLSLAFPGDVMEAPHSTSFTDSSLNDRSGKYNAWGISLIGDYLRQNPSAVDKYLEEKGYTPFSKTATQWNYTRPGKQGGNSLTLNPCVNESGIKNWSTNDPFNLPSDKMSLFDAITWILYGGQLSAETRAQTWKRIYKSECGQYPADEFARATGQYPPPACYKNGDSQYKGDRDIQRALNLPTTSGTIAQTTTTATRRADDRADSAPVFVELTAETLANPQTRAELPARPEAPRPELPEAVLNYGVFKDLTRAVQYGQAYEQPELNFAGAEAFIKFISSVRVCARLSGGGGFSPSAFPHGVILALSEQGTGKEAPRRLANYIYKGGEFPLNGVASIQALNTAIANRRRLWCNLDEFGDWLEETLDGNANARALVRGIKIIFSQASNPNAVLEDQRAGAEREGRAPLKVAYPALTVFGTGVPSAFAQTCGRGLEKDGFFARLTVYLGRKNPTRPPHDYTGDHTQQEQDRRKLDAYIYSIVDKWARFNTYLEEEPPEEPKKKRGRPRKDKEAVKEEEEEAPAPFTDSPPVLGARPRVYYVNGIETQLPADESEAIELIKQATDDETADEIGATSGGNFTRAVPEIGKRYKRVAFTEPQQVPITATARRTLGEIEQWYESETQQAENNNAPLLAGLLRRAFEKLLIDSLTFAVARSIDNPAGVVIDFEDVEVANIKTRYHIDCFKHFLDEQQSAEAEHLDELQVKCLNTATGRAFIYPEFESTPLYITQSEITRLSIGDRKTSGRWASEYKQALKNQLIETGFLEPVETKTACAKRPKTIYIIHTENRI